MRGKFKIGQGKWCLLPVAAVLGVSLGAVGGAVALDHFAAAYLWPEPEDLVVRQTPARLPVPVYDALPTLDSDAS